MDPQKEPRKDGRGDWIRTSDLSVPNRALYQAEPRPDAKNDSTTPQPVSGSHRVAILRGECAVYGALAAIVSARADAISESSLEQSASADGRSLYIRRCRLMCSAGPVTICIRGRAGSSPHADLHQRPFSTRSSATLAASGYLGVMAFLNVPPVVLRPTALVLNIVVADHRDYSVCGGGSLFRPVILAICVDVGSLCRPWRQSADCAACLRSACCARPDCYRGSWHSSRTLTRRWPSFACYHFRLEAGLLRNRARD